MHSVSSRVTATTTLTLNGSRKQPQLPARKVVLLLGYTDAPRNASWEMADGINRQRVQFQDQFQKAAAARKVVTVKFEYRYEPDVRPPPRWGINE